MSVPPLTFFITYVGWNLLLSVRGINLQGDYDWGSLRPQNRVQVKIRASYSVFDVVAAAAVLLFQPLIGSSTHTPRTIY